MTLALLAIGLPCLILLLFLFECWQHQRELEKAEEEFNDQWPNTPPKE